MKRSPKPVRARISAQIYKILNLWRLHIFQSSEKDRGSSHLIYEAPIKLIKLWEWPWKEFDVKCVKYFTFFINYFRIYIFVIPQMRTGLQKSVERTKTKIVQWNVWFYALITRSDKQQRGKVRAYLVFRVKHLVNGDYVKPKPHLI